MLSIGLWRWYINITITILDIIQRPAFYLKHDVSETDFCLRLEAKPTQKDSTEWASLYLRLETGRWIMSRFMIVILIYHRHKPIDIINLLGS
jgi:hypothetical protein